MSKGRINAYVIRDPTSLNLVDVIGPRPAAEQLVFYTGVEGFLLFQRDP